MAGVVAAVGERVTRFRVGDRVMGAFMPDWVDGEPTPAKTALAPGAATDGVLAEEAVYAEHGLVATPAGLSDEEAATLPCAAVTAWNALFVGGRAAGQTALLLGTGGVSIWGCSWPRPPACGPSSPRPATASWNRRANWARMC